MISANKINSIVHDDARKHYEATEDSVLRIGLPKIPQGLSPRSSASLYLRTHNSTPWAILANSLDSTFFSRYSIISGGNVTLRDCFLRVMHSSLVQIIINICTNNWSIALNLSAGSPTYARKQPISDSYRPIPGYTGPVGGERGRTCHDSGVVAQGHARRHKGCSGGFHGGVVLEDIGHRVRKVIGGLIAMADRILIDIRTCELTLSQVMEKIAGWQAIMPDHEIFMDGDAYAIVARPREVES